MGNVLPGHQGGGGIGQLLRKTFYADLSVVAEASDGRKALDLVRAGGIDVMVMDISMGERGGVDALGNIKARAPKLPVLFLSSMPEEHYAVALLQQGASGYLGLRKHWTGGWENPC